ncbi:MAG: hypothetical protein HQ488_03980 [Parcubacteria group bacterium]|nr:hypothetical protein [Parcubacteria group bacterium]
MKKIFLALLLFVPAMVLLQGVGSGSAQTATQQTNQIQYPVSWLDDCNSEADCRDYCTNVFNNQMCYEAELSFGVVLLTDFARDTVESVIDGTIYPIPELGNCDSYNDCEDYCEIPTNLAACFDIEMIYGMHLLTQEQRDAFTQGPTSYEGEQEPEPTSYEGEQEQQTQSTTAMSNIVYPIETLGNCDSAADCQIYCDNVANYDACLVYGVANRMYAPEREQVAQAVLEGRGPSECRGQTCTQTCDAATSRAQCVEFAADNGAISAMELSATRAIIEDPGPGGCVTARECEVYCGVVANEQECFDYAVEQGLTVESERGRVEALRADGPGGCQGERECAVYCAQEQHFDECMRFAITHGLMTPEEEQLAFDLHYQQLDGPGGCRGERECAIYCSVVAHEQECLQYALDSGNEMAVEALAPNRARSVDLQDVPVPDDRVRDAQPDFIMVEDPETGGQIRLYLEDLLNEANREFVHPVGCDTIDGCRDFCDLPENRDACKPFAG